MRRKVLRTVYAIQRLQLVSFYNKVEVWYTVAAMKDDSSIDP